MGYTGIGPASEPEPVQLPADREWRHTFIINDGAPLGPVADQQDEYKDAEIAKLRAELDEARRRIAAALNDHEPFKEDPEGVDWCECGFAWPCMTRRALTGAEGGDSGGE